MTTERKRLDLVSFTEGGGSTFQAITESTRDGVLTDKVRVVGMIAGQDGAGSIKRAEHLEVPYAIIDRRKFPKGKEGTALFARALMDQLNIWSPDIVTQNGWLTLTPKLVINEVVEIYNQHPAPLDPEHVNAYGKPLHFGGRGMIGLAPHAAVLYFQSLTGKEFPTEATIHRVTPEFDEGAVVYRTPVEVKRFDKPETLQRRVLPEEHAAHIKFLTQAYMGEIAELYREQPLIEDADEMNLWTALDVARSYYPNG